MQKGRNSRETMKVAPEFDDIYFNEQEWSMYKMQPPCQWFSLHTLASTLFHAIVSGIANAHVDFRLLQSIAEQKESVHDYASLDEIWIDYVCDTGDGFDATYSILNLIARDSLSMEWANQSYHTQRGRILIMGGDEVYPVANYREYLNRLIFPMRAAFPNEKSIPTDIFAIPGNHDWYEGLSSFANVFLSGRKIGGWRAAQRLSYFALKLPHNWWILGLDTALNSEIDNRQLDYFDRIIKEDMDEMSRVVLCAPEPFWITEALNERKTPRVNLDFLVKRLLKFRYCPLFLSGDLHHYRHHSTSADDTKGAVILPQIHYYTAGGGGAFLHATHIKPCDAVQTNDFRSAVLQSEYPSKAESRKLSYRNLMFLKYNPGFCLCGGFVYLFFSTTLPTNNIDASDFWGDRLFDNGISWMFLITFLALGFFYGKLSSNKWHGQVVGFINGFLIIAAALVSAWFGVYVRDQFDNKGIAQVVSMAAVLLSSTLIFGTHMGLYLTVCQNVFGMHFEDFSAIIVDEYRHFLRLHIDKEGDLHIYSIGVRHPVREWVVKSIDGGSRFHPAVGDICRHLIEEPVIIPGARHRHTSST
eukprot:TRINITY_DN3481_c0_g1_i6.p1 TRINITY_DN3481_c0_g1~~TRINITY_DN3481_c0_g1_i6.p1  ORF type:complete len:585 (-),score=84.59 TRINITY_DN3481_c0_g1_i6:67-1821(-)